MEKGTSMNWYKKSNNENIVQNVINYLSNLGIKNEIDGSLIKVNRDSIINFSTKEDENESYEDIISMLSGAFNAGFAYALRNDDWLWIEIRELSGKKKLDLPKGWKLTVKKDKRTGLYEAHLWNTKKESSPIPIIVPTLYDYPTKAREGAIA